MDELITREKAVALALEYVPADAVIIAANGNLSRVLYSTEDRPGAFYMIGSMGLAPSIGLGMSLAFSEGTVAVFDGDGNVLMNMGALATVAANRPRRFVHLCFDNESYGSTGGQRSLSGRVDLDRVAAGAGYRYTAHALSEGSLRAALGEAFACEGPAFVLIKIRPGGLPAGTPRVALTPPSMARRTRAWVLGGASA